MTHPVYSEQQLSAKTIAQLKEIAQQMGCTPLGDKRAKTSWVQAILKAQPQPKTCATCPNFKPHNDGTANGWCCLFDTAARSHHQTTGDCINTMDAQQEAQAELEQYIEEQSAEVVRAERAKFQSLVGIHVVHPLPPHNNITLRAERAKTIEVVEVTHNPENNHYYVVRPNHPDPHERCECGESSAAGGSPSAGNWRTRKGDCHYRGAKCKHQIAVQNFTGKITQSQNYDIEIDAVPDSDFGNLYRVWQGMRLLGTFYQSLDGDWVARSTGSTAAWYCSSADEAQHLITEPDDEIDDLLDKPFDQLSPQEWEQLKVA